MARDPGRAKRADRRAAWWPVAALALGLALPAGAADEDAPDECAAWPGEPTPLPSTTDPDTYSARWAELRAQEIAVRAQLAEPSDPMEGLRLWRRVLCLDPNSSPAWNGIARTQAVRVHTPDTAWGRRRAAPLRDPWAQLAQAVYVPRPAPALTPQTRARLAEAETQLGESEAHLTQARFAEALASARAAQTTLEDLSANLGAARRLRARAEVAAATAHVALGDAAQAQASFARALAANPRLSLDPRQTSPKVIEALDAARAGNGAAR